MPRLEQAQVEREGDQPLLRPVVQVPLQALALVLRGFDDPGARAPQLLEPGSQVGLQPTVLERDPGCCADGVEQFGLVGERRVVHQRRDVAPSRSISVVARPPPVGSSTARPSRSA